MTVLLWFFVFFCFIISESNMSNLTWNISFFSYNCWLCSLSSILCLRFPQSFAFTYIVYDPWFLPLCCIIVCLPPLITLALSKHFILKDSLHFAYDIEKLINPRHLPVWHFSNFLVQSPTTYFLVLLQSFGRLFLHLFFWSHCLLKWVDFFGSLYFGESCAKMVS